MKRTSNFALLLLLVAHGVSSAQEAAPKLINYQGKLTDAVGAPLGGSAGGTYSLKFEIFDVPTGGTAAWGETRQVAVVDGVFNVVLGGVGGTNIVGDLGAAFTGKDRYLQTTVLPGAGVATQQVLLPRQQLASVPFAIQAQKSALADVATLAQSLIPELSRALNPPGTIIAYAGAGSDSGTLQEVVPGYLLCNGAVIDATTANGKYAPLVAVIGKNWGHGGNAAATNLANLPDLRGVFLRGINGAAGDKFVNTDPRELRLPGGATSGVGSFQMDELKQHRHYLGTKGLDGNGVNLRRDFSYSDYNEGRVDQSYTYNEGGSETRGKNANVVYLIRY